MALDFAIAAAWLLQLPLVIGILIWTFLRRGPWRVFLALLLVLVFWLFMITLQGTSIYVISGSVAFLTFLVWRIDERHWFTTTVSIFAFAFSVAAVVSMSLAHLLPAVRSWVVELPSFLMICFYPVLITLLFGLVGPRRVPN